MKESIGQFIVRRRKELKMSQRALAKEAKISQYYLVQIENDRVQNFEVLTLYYLSQALKVRLDDLTHRLCIK